MALEAGVWLILTGLVAITLVAYGGIKSMKAVLTDVDSESDAQSH